MRPDSRWSGGHVSGEERQGQLGPVLGRWGGSPRCWSTDPGRSPVSHRTESTAYVTKDWGSSKKVVGVEGRTSSKHLWDWSLTWYCLTDRKGEKMVGDHTTELPLVPSGLLSGTEVQTWITCIPRQVPYLIEPSLWSQKDST